MRNRTNIVLLCLCAFVLSCTRNELVEITDDGLPPSPPAGLAVYAAYDGQIGIEWEPNRENDIAGYNIFRSVNDTSNFKSIDTTENSYYVDSGLEYETTYYYKITALDRSELESSTSETVFAKPSNVFNPGKPLSILINGQNRHDSIRVLLFWQPPFDTDIEHYEIHRSTEEDFTSSAENLIGVVKNLRFTDTKNLDILTKYYYKIISVDRGGLKSRESDGVSDLVLNKPEPVFPSDKSEIKPFNTFQIKTCSAPADYKIIIQTDPNYGIVSEVSFKSTEIDQVINVTFNAYFITPFRKYYWRVLSYTSDKQNPNSVSDQYSFTVIVQ